MRLPWAWVVLASQIRQKFSKALKVSPFSRSLSPQSRLVRRTQASMLPTTTNTIRVWVASLLLDHRRLRSSCKTLRQKQSTLSMVRSLVSYQVSFRSMPMMVKDSSWNNFYSMNKGQHSSHQLWSILQSRPAKRVVSTQTWAVWTTQSNSLTEVESFSIIVAQFQSLHRMATTSCLCCPLRRLATMMVATVRISTVTSTCERCPRLHQKRRSSYMSLTTLDLTERAQNLLRSWP